MEALNAVMTKACDLGIFQGLSTPNWTPRLSHLFYAYDALFVGEWSQINLQNLARILGASTLPQILMLTFQKEKCSILVWILSSLIVLSIS